MAKLNEMMGCIIKDCLKLALYLLLQILSVLSLFISFFINKKYLGILKDCQAIHGVYVCVQEQKTTWPDGANHVPMSERSEG